MRHLAALLALLLLAACAPAYLTPAPGGAVLPVEAQRVIDQATATAAAMATSGAQAAASEQAFERAATAARAATLDALGVQETQESIQTTSRAVLDASTVTTAIRTQAARDTAAWATPSAAAVRTQAALDAQSQAQSQRDAQAASEFWATLRTTIWALLIVGALTLITVVGLDHYFDAQSRRQLAELRAKAEIAKEAFRLLPPTHWAEWRPDDGYQVYPLPGQLEAPPTVIENTTPNPSRLHDWRHAVRLAGWWATLFGFGIRDIGPPGKAVVSDGGWRMIFGGNGVLRVAGAVVDRPTEGEKGKKAGWADGWSYARLSDDLSHGRLDHLFPSDGEAPKIAFTVPTHHHTTAEVPQPHA